MSKGLGSTQVFILQELSKLTENEWMLVQDLIQRFAEQKRKPVTQSIDRTLRNGYRTLANPLNPKVELRRVNGALCIRLTDDEHLRMTKPWLWKDSEIARLWREQNAIH